MDHFELADKLEKEKNLTDDEFAGILLCEEPEFDEYLAEVDLSCRRWRKFGGMSRVGYGTRSLYFRFDERLD